MIKGGKIVNVKISKVGRLKSIGKQKERGKRDEVGRGRRGSGSIKSPGRKIRKDTTLKEHYVCSEPSDSTKMITEKPIS